MKGREQLRQGERVEVRRITQCVIVWKRMRERRKKASQRGWGRGSGHGVV